MLVPLLLLGVRLLGAAPDTAAPVASPAVLARAEAAIRAYQDSLRFEPGTSTLYSNAGYTLLACGIEGASGASYDEYLRRAILAPAGMRNTFPDEVYRVMPHVARGYLVRTAQNTKAWEGLWTAAHLASTTLDVPAPADPLDASIYPGAGNYRSTPSDMARFVLALERGALLSDSMRTRVFTEVVGGRTLGDWLLSRQGDQLVARVLGSVWTGSFALVTVPGPGRRGRTWRGKMRSGRPGAITVPRRRSRAARTGTR